MRVGRAFLQTLFTQSIQSVASVSTGILIARGLGPVGQGKYALLVAAIGFLSTMGAGGQFEGNVLASAGQRSRGRLLLIRSTAQALIVLSVMVATRSVWRTPLGLGQNGGIQILFLAVLVLEILALLFRGINLGQHHITSYNVTTLIQRLLFLAFAVVIGATLGLDLVTALAAWAGAVLTSVLVAAALIWSQSERTLLSWGALLSDWGSSLLKGFRALLTICLSLLLVRTDVYMLGPMLGVAAVGQISVASTLTEYLWYVPSILGNVLFAAVASDSGPESVRKICRAVRTTVVLVGAAVLVLAAVGRQLVLFMYGAAYAKAATVVVLLLPGMFAIAVHMVLDSYFAGRSFPPISYLSAAGAVVVKVIGNLILVPRAGLSGAAISTSIAYLALLGSKIVAFTRVTGVSPKVILIPTIDDVANGAKDWVRWVRGAIRA
jgi:O-antigen/teichoic acid export membrane protein